MRSNVLLWIVQILLAVVFLFAGGMKLVLPLEALALPIALPSPLIRFIGVAEVLGAVGLVLPRFSGVLPALTTIAAAGLMIIVSGATIVTLLGDGVVPALFPVVLALLCASVACGRWPPGMSDGETR